jgi:hypothetical protein
MHCAIHGLVDLAAHDRVSAVSLVRWEIQV